METSSMKRKDWVHVILTAVVVIAAVITVIVLQGQVKSAPHPPLPGLPQPTVTSTPTPTVSNPAPVVLTATLRGSFDPFKPAD